MFPNQLMHTYLFSVVSFLLKLQYIFINLISKLIKCLLIKYN